MKRLTTFIALVFCCQSLFAQNSLIDGGVQATSPSFFLDYLRDDKSKDLFRPDLYAGIEGSPYLSNDWAYARIKLDDGRRFDSVLLKINLYENKVHFKDENGNERMIGTGVKEIEFRDYTSKWNNAVFVTGYGTNENVFYQAITDGKKAGLLKTVSVIVKETKVFNAPNQKSFDQQGTLYVYAKGVLYPESKGCSSMMAAFGNDSKVTSFISANGLKCNKETDLKKLVEYYNSY